MRWLREAGIALLLAAGIGAVAQGAYARAGRESLDEPLSYHGDSLAFLACLKAARDGHVAPLRPIEVPELNAPFGANWNDFPNRQPTLLWLAGLLARRLGLFATVNLLLLGAHLLAGLAFYGTARYLRARREWAIAGAVAFAFSPYIFWRADHHLSLSLYGHVPLLLLVLAWAGSRKGLALRGRRFAFSLAAAALTGLGNVYYAALFVQLLALAAAGQLLRGRSRLVLAPLLLALTTMGAVVGENAYYLAYQRAEGPNPGAFKRSYGDVERLALKPIELLLPRTGTGLLDWGTGVRRYWLSAAVQGERGPSYLGLVGGAALLWLLGRPAVRALRRQPVRAPPALLGVLWVLAFSVVGGLNGLLSLVSPPWIRGTNRFSVWILAVALLWGALALSRAGWAGRRWRSVAAAALAAGLALADQVHVPRSPRGTTRPETDSPADARFVAALESRLGEGASLFQLPVTPFPEQAPAWRMGEYEQFRPYIHSTGLRFSYGTDRGRPRDAWPGPLAGKPPREIARRLESYGFAGLLVSRRGFPDGGAALLEGLAEAGRPAALESEDGRLVFVPLEPAPRPRKPGVPLLFAGGWEEEGDPEGEEGRWSTGDAEWVLTNEGARPRRLRLSFRLAAARPRQVALMRGRRPLASWRVAGSLGVEGLVLEAPPGRTRLRLRTDRPAEEVADGDGRPIAFQVSRLVVAEEEPGPE